MHYHCARDTHSHRFLRGTNTRHVHMCTNKEHARPRATKTSYRSPVLPPTPSLHTDSQARPRHTPDAHLTLSTHPSTPVTSSKESRASTGHTRLGRRRHQRRRVGTHRQKERLTCGHTRTDAAGVRLDGTTRRAQLQLRLWARREPACAHGLALVIRRPRSRRQLCRRRCSVQLRLLALIDSRSVLLPADLLAARIASEVAEEGSMKGALRVRNCAELGVKHDGEAGLGRAADVCRHVRRCRAVVTDTREVSEVTQGQRRRCTSAPLRYSAQNNAESEGGVCHAGWQDGRADLIWRCQTDHVHQCR